MTQFDEYFCDGFEVLNYEFGETIQYRPHRKAVVELDAIVDHSPTEQWFVAGDAVSFSAVIRIHGYVELGINPDQLNAKDQFKISERSGGTKKRLVSFQKLISSDGGVLEIGTR